MIKKECENVDLYNWHAVAKFTEKCMGKGKHEIAKIVFEQFKKKDGKMTKKMQINLALCYFELEEYDNAIKCFKELPRDALYHDYVGRSYFRKQEYKKAIESLSLVINHHKNYDKVVLAYYFRARARFELKNLERMLDNAKKDIDTAIEMDSRNGKFYFWRAQIRKAMGDKEYIKDYKKISEWGDLKSKEWVSVIKDLVQTSKYQSAVESYKRVQKEDLNDDAELHLCMGKTYNKLENYKLALEEYRSAAKIEKSLKKDNGFLLKRGDLFLKLQEFEKAEKDFKYILSKIDDTDIESAIDVKRKLLEALYPQVEKQNEAENLKKEIKQDREQQPHRFDLEKDEFKKWGGYLPYPLNVLLIKFIDETDEDSKVKYSIKFFYAFLQIVFSTVFGWINTNKDMKRKFVEKFTKESVGFKLKKYWWRNPTESDFVTVLFEIATRFVPENPDMFGNSKNKFVEAIKSKELYKKEIYGFIDKVRNPGSHHNNVYIEDAKSAFVNLKEKIRDIFEEVKIVSCFKSSEDTYHLSVFRGGRDLFENEKFESKEHVFKTNVIYLWILGGVYKGYEENELFIPLNLTLKYNEEEKILFYNGISENFCEIKWVELRRIEQVVGDKYKVSFNEGYSDKVEEKDSEFKELFLKKPEVIQ
ncbi:MAG: tetratricopeptide repeat protein [bacterium]